jgi:hypothetical protein
MQSLLTTLKYERIWKWSGGRSDSLLRGQHIRLVRLTGSLYIRSQARAIWRHNLAPLETCYFLLEFSDLSRDFKRALVSCVLVLWSYYKQLLFSIRILFRRIYYRIILHSSYRASNRFLFNNQPDALIIQIYSVIKLYKFRASSLPIIRSFLLYIRHW